jgi:hypothetical protein
MKVLMHALAASCEELRARTGNPPLCRFSTCEFFRAKRIFHFYLVSQLEPSGSNWIKTKEKFASREKIRKWKTGFIEILVNQINSLQRPLILLLLK